MQLTTLSQKPLPGLFDFVFQLGGLVGKESDSAMWFVLTMPSLDYVAQMMGMGALFGLLESGALDKRVGAEELNPDSLVTWLTADKEHVKCGKFLGISEETSRSGLFKLAPIGNNAQTYRQLDKFDEFKFSPYFGAPFNHERKLSGNTDIVNKFSKGRALDLTTQSRNEICFVGDPRLSAELMTTSFAIDGVRGCGDDVLRVENLFDARESPHYLSRFIKTMSQGTDDPGSQIAIFDGAAAYQRHGTYLSARTKIVLLNRWDKNSMDAVVKLKKTFARSKPELLDLGKLEIPQGVELLAWRTSGN